MAELKFRVGLEIETSFEGQSEISNGTETCLLSEKNDGHYGVKNLPTTQDPKTSLFRGKPEPMATRENEQEYCNVELIINPNRQIFFDGEKLIDETNKSVMEEYEKEVTEWKTNKIIKCGNREATKIQYPKNPSTCGVHLHISAPFMENEPEHKKKLYKILVFYLWYTKYQDKFGTKNENWIHGFKNKCNNWGDAPYLTATTEDDGSLKIGKGEYLFNLPNYETLNRFLTQYEINFQKINYNALQMVQEQSIKLTNEIDNFYKTLPGAEHIKGDSISRGVNKSNIIIVDPRFKNRFPHFEFRGHNDIMVKNYISDTSFFTDNTLPNLPLIDYIEAVYNFLKDAYEILNKSQLLHTPTQLLPTTTQSAGKKNKKKTNKKNKKKKKKKKKNLN